MRAPFICMSNDGHARDFFILRRTHRERINVDGQTPRQGSDAIEHAGLVFDVGDKCLHVLSPFLLWLGRRLDKRIVRAANHIAQGSARCNHGIYGIFLLDAEIDQHGFVRFARGAYDRHDFSALGDTFTADAEGIGERGKVRRDQGSSDVALVVEELLPLADHAEIAVVDDSDLDVDLFLDDGSQFAHGHLESAVTHDDPDFGARFRELRADGGRKSKAHGAESARSNQRTGLIVMVILRFPHLMLADVGDDDGLAARFFPDVVDDVRGVEVPVVRQALNIAYRGIALQFSDMTNPRAVIAGLDVRRKPFEYLARIADEGSINLHILVDFGAVNFNVDLAGALGISAQVSGDAVVKTHADGNKQVGFLNRVIHPSFAMHAHHAKVQRIIGREAADAEERHGDGIIAGTDELLKGAHRAGNHDAVACENDGALGSVQHFDGAVEFSLIVIIAHAFRRKFWLRRFPIELSGSLLRVFGDVDKHWAWPPAVGDQEGFTNGPGNVLRLRDHHVVFGDGHGDARDIDLLKGV